MNQHIENNIVLAAMSKVMEARFNKDMAVLDSLLDETSRVNVSLADVVLALDVILEDVENIMDANFELMEYRMFAIVEALDEVTQARIRATFIDNDDYMFSHIDDEKGDKK